jgi:glycine betaine/proline transport system permease protein
MTTLPAPFSEKVPLGAWLESLVESFTERYGEQLGALSDGLGAVLERFIQALGEVYPLVLIGLLCAAAWGLQRSVRLVLLTALGLLLILNLGYWQATLETLALVLCSTAVSMVVGVPLGIATAHRRWLDQVLSPVLDLMQTIPTFVYLIPTLMLFGLGMVPGLISTIIFVLPAPIRLTSLGIRQVPPALREAGEAFGATRWQMLLKVELPHALPSIMAGVTQAIMLSLSMVVIAALVGADGLGKPVVRALNSVNVGMGFEAGLCIVVLAIVLDRLLRRAEPAAAASTRER